MLRLILDCLSQHDLCRVCLAHPQLRHLAEPPLYSKLELYYDQEKYSTHHPITSLIRTILRRPDLGPRVRSLSCSRGKCAKDTKSLRIPVRETDLEEALSFVEKTGLAYRDTWKKKLRQGALDAFLAVLLTQLSRLRSLYLGHAFSCKADLVTLVLRGMLFESHPERPIPGISSTTLHQLQTVSIHRFIESAQNAESVLPFFYLPSIQSISAAIPNAPISAFPWPTPQPPSAPTLRVLYLSYLREAHLGPLLAAAPRLHTLHWQWRFDPDVAVDASNSPTADLDLIMSALTPLRDTLTELRITAFCAYSTQAFIPLPLRVRGSMAPLLTHFHQLRTLSLPLVFLTGFELPVRARALAACLPRAIEELTLTDDLYVDVDTEEPWDATGHAAAVRDWLALAADVRASAPRLRRLRLLMRGENGEVCAEERVVRGEIRELARAAGIELVVDPLY